MDISYDERRRRNLADNKRILAEIGLLNPVRMFSDFYLNRDTVALDTSHVTMACGREGSITKQAGRPKCTKRPCGKRPLKTWWHLEEMLFRDNSKLNCKKTGIRRKSEPVRKPKRPLLELNVDTSTQGSIIGTRRKSARLQGQTTPKREDPDYLPDDEEDEEWDGEEKTKRKFKQPTYKIKYSHVKVEKNRPNFYGAVEGVEVGTIWLTRMECCRDGVHRPTVAGIHAGQEGAYSIALSGGYDDNVDWGECFTYTGEGGRDLKGTPNKPKNLRMAPQSKDQTLTRGNLALSKNVETGNPVRVIRGYKLNSPFAPEEGYRYDGLYTVEKAWFTTGLSGFGVWKFALKRLDDQAPPPWEFTEATNMDEANNNEKEGLSTETPEESCSEDEAEDEGQQEEKKDLSPEKENEQTEADDVADEEKL